MSAPRIKVGIVGCGVVATAYYLPYLQRQPDAIIGAVCDINSARTAACRRLFGATEEYQDYHEMLHRADLDAVFILTGPGTHVKFTLAALEAGKHVLLQKPMALELAGAEQIVAATRRAGLRVLIEPSQASPLDPLYREIRRLVRAGVLGAPCWFTLIPKGPETYGPALSGNPYGVGAFYAKDSGGMLFDFPYGPNEIVSVLGSCKSVTGLATIAAPDALIVPDSAYDAFLARCTDPDEANYWRVVTQLPRTQPVKMEAPDQVFSLYKMADGSTGVFHCGRLHHPVAKGTGYGGLQVFGPAGNLVFDGDSPAQIITQHRELLPSIDADGWFRFPKHYIAKPETWPIPAKGAFNYYEESTRELLNAIREKRDPVPNVEWGRHITEMMHGAMESARTGRCYELTTSVDW